MLLCTLIEYVFIKSSHELRHIKSIIIAVCKWASFCLSARKSSNEDYKGIVRSACGIRDIIRFNHICDE